MNHEDSGHERQRHRIARHPSARQRDPALTEQTPRLESALKQLLETP
ncbi:MAG: hypothetical protein QF614_04595 [SAR324 cluster bacterium]|nr:hypothetical protein [SAR324 cluster bacterium]